MKKKVSDKRILELIKEGIYPSKIAKILRVSGVAIWKRIKKLEKAGKIKRISKNPSFYVLTNTEECLCSGSRLGINHSMFNSMYSSKLEHRNLIHSTHHIKFSINYKGTQPRDGATKIKPFGRYKTAIQSIYKLTDRITIVAFKNKLNVWVHKPEGKLTQNQMINAKRDGYLALLGFAKSFHLTLQDSLEKVLRSHHVVEEKRVNTAFKPVFKQYEREIEAQIGSKVCQTSHKGKIEHEGKKREEKVILGSDVAKGLERLILDVPEKIDKIECIEGKYGYAIESYNLNIEKHLRVMEEISKGLKKMGIVLDKMEEKL